MNNELRTMLEGVLAMPDSAGRDLIMTAAAEWWQTCPRAPLRVFLDTRYDPTERALLLDLLDAAVNSADPRLHR